MKRFLLVLIFLLPTCHHQVDKDPRIVLLEGPEWSGTGFYVQGASGKTYIITNAHVCQNERMLIVFTGKEPMVSPVIGVYPNADLCVITAVTGIKGFKLADSYFVGENVKTLGYPMGERSESHGKVEGLQYAPDFQNFYLFTSATSRPGSSGSPAIDPDGRVIGVVALGNSSSFVHQSGLVPLAYLKDCLRNL